MAKLFLETFPTIPFSEEEQTLLQFVTVLHVNYTKDRQTIRVYIRSSRLISKKIVYHLEKKLKQQLFPNQAIQVKIMEQFDLSEQYTPQKLLDAYQDSIMMEIQNTSELEYHLLKKAKWKFEKDDLLSLEMEDSMWARNREHDLQRWLTKVFCDRCGFSMYVRMKYVQAKTSELRKQMEEKEQQEIQAILNGVVNKKEEPIQEVSNTTEKKQEKRSFVKEPIQPSRTVSERPKKEFRKKWEGAGKRYIRSDNPDVIFGRDFTDPTIEIKELVEEMGEVAIRGKILAVDTRELRNGQKTIVTFPVTDLTDTIMVKIFIDNEHLSELLSNIKKGNFVTVKGMSLYDKFDHEIGISSVIGIKKCEDFTNRRMDHAPEKRVELHCHTKASEMDAVTEVKDLIHNAKAWGHKAMAVTDHGCVYAFPDAFHALKKGDDFKVIYGVEGYLVDDMKEIVMNHRNQSLDATYVVFDIETTGFSPLKNKIIEIGAVKVEKGKIVDRFSTFINPGVPIPFKIEQLTGISDSMVLSAPDITAILPEFLEFCKDAVLVAHNASFDMSFILHNAKELGYHFDPTYLDTVGLARYLLPKLRRYKLDVVAKELGVSLENHHRAVDDAEATAGIFQRLLDRLKQQGITNLEEVEKKAKLGPEAIKKLPTYHIIVLAATEVGRVNLYRLVSFAHLNYFARRPRFPRSELLKYREGLIFGSACEAGELYQSILRGESEADIAKIVNFYDYLEIQPLGNDLFMLEKEDYPVNSIEDLKEINRKIVRLGEEFNKPVCATCDVHFMNPEDEVYRRIIMAGKGFADADHQPPLYYRTTEEMLKEFEYLGSEKAYEVVVTNTNLIADRIDYIEPVRPDKCPPVIENSDVELREMCYKKARSMYGETLPKIVEDRLEKELNSIISNGFAVMYIIAQRLVTKSNEDGYMVGSRGSVGSSFVATMSNITEVNPLPPHYYCPDCHYSDFDSEEVRSHAGGAGCDMPDKNCPVCGTKMKKDGFDIPFETFLGFYGDKEPDIDLNFSGEYQSRAHAYTEVIFGEGHTFRAGTIGTLADKTAFGYVKNYYEERGIHKRVCEINRIVEGCTGVRRTSGQHPGGIIVLPHGEEIYSFTPVQHPANDMTTNIITTHFDYHSIDHNLLKLDILGHDDPTMIRMLEDLTGQDARTFPLDSKEVMSLFKDTSALGITPEDIHGCKLGALGIPEFGTDFAMQMLIDTKPRYFSDLVRIAGLSHGTDVWLGNAQTLLKEGKATISTAICTRDDIMIYLISKGVEKGLSFKIMESVRKGKGLTPEWEEEMVKHDVPDWYIWSCKKIKYMFPKAHAAAYVMMAWRIAYCKVFYPLAYYAAFFSIRATGFTYELMCMGKEKLENAMADYERRMDSLSKKEQDTYKDMRIVQEMYARGFDFLPLDVYKAKANRFQIMDGKLMPSLSSIDGLGEKAADSIVEAAKDGPFLSQDDFRTRAKVSKTVVDKMVELGILEGLPESNQLSLFDFT